MLLSSATKFVFYVKRISHASSAGICLEFGSDEKGDFPRARPRGRVRSLHGLYSDDACYGYGFGIKTHGFFVPLRKKEFRTRLHHTHVAGSSGSSIASIREALLPQRRAANNESAFFASANQIKHSENPGMATSQNMYIRPEKEEARQKKKNCLPKKRKKSLTHTHIQIKTRHFGTLYMRVFVVPRISYQSNSV